MGGVIERQPRAAGTPGRGQPAVLGRAGAGVLHLRESEGWADSHYSALRTGRPDGRGMEAMDPRGYAGLPADRQKVSGRADRGPGTGARGRRRTGLTRPPGPAALRPSDR